MTAVDQVPDNDIDLIDAVAEFHLNPLGFVLFVFPWGESGTPLYDQDGPDYWQIEVLQKLEKALKQGVAADKATATAIRIAVKSGHGVGKTTLVAWIIHWFMATRANPQVVVTANTATQLTSKTWRELAKWHRMSLCKSWFILTRQTYYAKHAPETWCTTAIPWSKDRPEAFAGTHEKHVLVLMDEASAIDDAIWEVTEGAMTTPGAIWIVFGNPTRNTGRFRECWREFAKRWITVTVDSRTAKMANKSEIQMWREDYGEDSDFFRVRVRGEFPRAASMQFISEEMVMEAEQRTLLDIEWNRQARVFGLDVAYHGDDRSILLLRQGVKIHHMWKLPELDPDQLAYKCLEIAAEHDHEAFFIEEVGIGVGTYTTMKNTGYDRLHPIKPQWRATDERTYYNKRAEMWGRSREWIKKRGCLMINNLVDKELRQELTSIEYSFDNKGRYQLESKRDLKSRGLRSSDLADSLVLTFGLPIPDPPELVGGEEISTLQQKLEDHYYGNNQPGSWKVR